MAGLLLTLFAYRQGFSLLLFIQGPAQVQERLGPVINRNIHPLPPAAAGGGPSLQSCREAFNDQARLLSLRGVGGINPVANSQNRRLLPGRIGVGLRRFAAMAVSRFSGEIYFPPEPRSSRKATSAGSAKHPAVSRLYQKAPAKKRGRRIRE